LNTQSLSLIVAERHHADPPAQRHQRHQTHDHQRHDDLHVARLDADRLPSSQKVMAGSWL